MEVELYAVVTNMREKHNVLDEWEWEEAEADPTGAKVWTMDLTVPSWPSPPSYMRADSPLYTLNRLGACYNSDPVWDGRGYHDDFEDLLKGRGAVKLTGELNFKLGPATDAGDDCIQWSETLLIIRKVEETARAVEKAVNGNRPKPVLTEQEKADLKRNPALYSVPEFNPKTEGSPQNPIVLEASQPNSSPQPSSNNPQTDAILLPRPLKRSHSSTGLSDPSSKEPPTKHTKPTPVPKPARPLPGPPKFHLRTAIITHATLQQITIFYPVIRDPEGDFQTYPLTLTLSVLPSAWPASVTAPWEDTGLDLDLVLNKEIYVDGHISKRRTTWVERLVWKGQYREFEKAGTELVFVAEKIAIKGEGMRHSGRILPGGGYGDFEPPYRWSEKERKWIDGSRQARGSYSRGGGRGVPLDPCGNPSLMGMIMEGMGMSELWERRA